MSENGYKPLKVPMVKETGKRVRDLLNEPYQGNFIDEMTNGKDETHLEYTLTKIHKEKRAPNYNNHCWEMI